MQFPGTCGAHRRRTKFVPTIFGAALLLVAMTQGEARATNTTAATQAPDQPLAVSRDAHAEHPATPAVREKYRYVTDDENWQPLCTSHPQPYDPYDYLKCIPLAKGKGRYLSLGGDIRLRYENYSNKGWNPNNGTDGYLLERDLVHADLHENRVRGYIELQHGVARGGRGAQDPTWRDDFSAVSAYGEYGFGGDPTAAKKPLSIRYGRQQLAYGSSRMVDNRTGPNTLQSMDGIRARAQIGNWQADLFTARPVTTAPYGFDDAPDRGSSFSGIYATRTKSGITTDVYVLEDQRARTVQVRGIHPSRRYSFGVRYAIVAPRIDLDTEVVQQYGSTGGVPVQAYMLASNVGYTWKRGDHKYRVGVSGSTMSGDDKPGGDRDTQFRPPYPSGFVFGLVQANGNINTANIAPVFTYTYKEKISASVREYRLYRNSLADGLYSPPGSIIRQPNGSNAYAVGTCDYVGVTNTFDRHATLTIAVARFHSGAFLEQSPAAANISSAPTTVFGTILQYKI